MNSIKLEKINQLPKDCLTLIFSFLDKNSIIISNIVCQKWREIISKEQFLYKLLLQR